MNVRGLESLLWAARLGGFGAAARHLHVTQPAITRRIRELEQELGTPLFWREKRQITLTPAGRKCLQIAERIVADVAALHEAAGRSTGVSGTIRIGVSEVIALSWLDRLLVRLKGQYPELHLELDVDLSACLVKKLDSRHIDIAFLPGPVTLPSAVTKSLGFCSLNWMSHPDLFQSERAIVPADLAEIPIITLPPDANAYSIMQSWFLEAGVKPRRVSYCNSFSVVASLVRKGLGVSLLPRDLFRTHIERGKMVIMPAQPRVAAVEYSVAYMPTSELAVLPDICLLACQESWFTGVSD